MIPRREHSCTGNCRGHRIMAMATDQSSAIFHSKTWKRDPNQVAKSSTTRYPISWSPWGSSNFTIMAGGKTSKLSPGWSPFGTFTSVQFGVGEKEATTIFEKWSMNDPWIMSNIKVGYDSYPMLGNSWMFSDSLVQRSIAPFSPKCVRRIGGRICTDYAHIWV